MIYYVGPVDPVRDEVVGPAGPTTATRMDKFTDMMLAKTGLLAMIGKAERGPVGDRGDPQAQGRLPDGGRRRGLSRVEGDQGGAVVAFADLGMEAIYEFEVKDMPVTVAVDADGTSVHETGPREWRQAASARSRSDRRGLGRRRMRNLRNATFRRAMGLLPRMSPKRWPPTARPGFETAAP